MTAKKNKHAIVTIFTTTGEWSVIRDGQAYRVAKPNAGGPVSLDDMKRLSIMLDLAWRLETLARSSGLKLGEKQE